MRKNNHIVNAGSLYAKHIRAERNLFIFFIILMIAIALNLTPFQSFDPRASLSGYPAIIKLADSGIIGGNIIAHRRGMYLALGQKAPDVDILLPTDNTFDIAQLYGFGRVRNIGYKNYDPETLFADYDYSNHIVTGFNADKRLGPGPFAIAMNRKPEAMIVLKRNETWHLVDISLLPTGNW